MQQFIVGRLKHTEVYSVGFDTWNEAANGFPRPQATVRASSMVRSNSLAEGGGVRDTDRSPKLVE